MKVGKRLRMNHLCKEDDTGEESNIGAAFREYQGKGARLNDSEMKKIETKPRDAIPEKEALDDNMSNDLRTPAGRIRKNDEQPDETITQ